MENRSVIDYLEHIDRRVAVQPRVACGSSTRMHRMLRPADPSRQRPMEAYENRSGVA